MKCLLQIYGARGFFHVACVAQQLQRPNSFPFLWEGSPLMDQFARNVSSFSSWVFVFVGGLRFLNYPWTNFIRRLANADILL